MSNSEAEVTTCSVKSNVGSLGPHDLGGSLQVDGDGHIEIHDHALAHWEFSIHALLVSLSSRKPGLLTTDELRRGVEALPKDQYDSWGYYERWAASMTTILLERQVISQEELDHYLSGDEEHPAHGLEPQLRFKAGDYVRVRSEDSKLHWCRPHLRCPGYIFGLVGKVVKLVGTFEDPSLLAFRKKGPKQALYVVTFPMKKVWESRSNAVDVQKSDFDGDLIEADIYQDWMEPYQFTEGVNDEGNKEKLDEMQHDHQHHEGHEHSHGHEHDHHDHDQHKHKDEHEHKHHEHCDHHDHGDDHKHCEHHDHDQHKHKDGHEHEHEHSHEHGHTHQNRDEVEQVAVEREGIETQGKVLGLALLRLLYDKQVIQRDQIQQIIERLQNAGKNMLGAEMVVHAWKDAAFKARLLHDAEAAGKELGINTSNPNAPTVLRVFANSATEHHVIVCTLCSCYPASVLGLSPSWYKSRNYRARIVREPRKVLEEFGLKLQDSVRVQVHDSTADCRYMVLPLPPKTLTAEDIATKSMAELKTYVTRDSMIGVAVL